MIDWLEIRNFAIASGLNLSFRDGFTAITGETGSGKSLMVDALAILLGGRSDNAWIKHGEEQAEIQAGFALAAGHPAIDWLKKHQLEQENDCLIRRILRRDKASRGYINGHATTAAQLRELGKQLTDIHSQHENHSLLRPATQQQLLDQAAGNQPLLATLAQQYDRVIALRNQQQQAHDQSRQVTERIDLLRFQLTELEALQPTPDEWPELEKQQKRLQYRQDIAVGSRAVAARLSEAENSLADGLNACIAQLKQLSRHDPDLGAVAGVLEEAEVNVSEAAQSLRRFYEDVHLQPEEIARIEQRFSLYHTLSRKHRVQPRELEALYQSLQQELARLQDPESEIARLTELHAEQMAAYQKVAGNIGRRRRRQAEKLSQQISALMHELGLRDAQFVIQLQPLAGDSIARHGLESVNFLISTNAGQPPQALNKVASGGELSRISLAIQVILANNTPQATLILDEVDIGISGAIAAIVGQKLQQLGQTRQVLCITHLAQVAAKGDDHLQVSKTNTHITAVAVVRLDQRQRVEEIARMSGGETLTPQSLAHARQLLGAA